MWILSFIPDSFLAWVINIILIAGIAGTIAGFFLKFIPFINRYSTVLQLVGVVLLVAGVYFKGSYSTEMHWRNKVDEMTAQIDRIKAESSKASKQVVYKYIERTKVVKEKNDAIRTQVTKYVTKEADANCTIPGSVVVLHDAAAKNVVPDSTTGINEGAARDVTLSRLLDTTVLNYGTFYEVKEQLKALQDWAREQKKINP
jgi:hypothetical protein